jgi:PilZ domain
MTGLIDYLKARFGKSGKPAAEERRASPRLTTHLERQLVVNVSLLDVNLKLDAARGPKVLAGYTRDISETGLGIVLQDVRLGSFNITRPERTLRIMLGIPGPPVEIHGTVVRHVKMEADAESGGGYLVGVKITHMSERDRSHYQDFLRSLQRKEQRKG